MALTDHDTLAGAREAAAAAEALGIRLLPGVELNTDAAGLEIDILGYFLEAPAAWFLDFLEARQAARIQRAQAMVERLNALGVHIRYERVRSLAHGALCRPHLAQALIEQGYAASQREVYQRYIGFGAPAYVERDRLDPLQAIGYIQAAGGLASVAHPGLVDDPAAVTALVEAGVDGLEAYYPLHTPEQSADYLALAQQRNLAVTAGSDAHGPGRTKSGAIGVAVAEDVWPALQRRLEQARHRRQPQPPFALSEAAP
jgi:3',5'-nucleoside bisphosphate phosphatase